MDQGSYAVEAPETLLRVADSRITVLENQIEVLKQQLKKLSEREMEARARMNAAEDMLEKFFDKMLDKMH